MKMNIFVWLNCWHYPYDLKKKQVNMFTNINNHKGDKETNKFRKDSYIEHIHFQDSDILVRVYTTHKKVW